MMTESGSWSPSSSIVQVSIPFLPSVLFCCLLVLKQSIIQWNSTWLWDIMDWGLIWRSVIDSKSTNKATRSKRWQKKQDKDENCSRPHLCYEVCCLSGQGSDVTSIAIAAQFVFDNGVPISELPKRSSTSQMSQPISDNVFTIHGASYVYQ